MRKAAVLSTISLLMLTNCKSSTDDPSDNPAGSETDMAIEGGAVAPESPSAPARNMADADSLPDDSVARPASAIPLTPGVYVLAGTSCGNPANAGFRIWTGAGLSGSATRACRASIVSREGERYTIDNDCENNYDGSRSVERLVMTVPDQVHFTVNGNAFASCSTAQVPEELRRLVDPGH